MPFRNVIIGTTETAITPTVPSGKVLIVGRLSFCNFDTDNDETITIYQKQNGKTSGDETTEYKDITIKKTDTGKIIKPGYWLAEGDEISAIAENGNRVSALLSYIIK